MAYESEGQPSFQGLNRHFGADDFLMNMADQMFQRHTRGDDWHAIHDAMEDYMWDEYSVALDDYVDWKEYGKWYDDVL